MHLFFWGENNHILVLVVQGNLAPVYFNIFGMKEKKKKHNLGKKKKTEINYLSTINIKENCKT